MHPASEVSNRKDIMENNDIGSNEGYKGLKPGTKVLVWLLGIMAVGVLVCLLLALLKIAAKVMVVAAAVLAVLVIIGIVGYNYTKEKVEDARQEHELRKLEDKEREESDGDES